MSDSGQRRAALAAIVLLAALVRLPFWMEAWRTPVDGDTAIVGLMAGHPVSGTAMWGQPYGSPLEAWIAAPALAVFGATAHTLRAVYFTLGLALVPLAYALGGALDRRAALPAALVAACPSPYILLLAAMPPPMYPSALLLSGLAIVLTLRAASRDGGPTPGLLALIGGVAGLAAWTHLMTLSVAVPCAAYLYLRVRARRRLLWVAAAFLVVSAPGWMRVVSGGQGASVVSPVGRRAGMVEHLVATAPSLHRPLFGLVGGRVPLVADEPTHGVKAPALASVVMVALPLVALGTAVAAARTAPALGLVLAIVALTVAVFPFPLRSGPSTIRFLTPLYMPLVALVGWAIARGRTTTAFALALVLAAANLTGATRLLAAWRAADREAAPFLLADLGPVRAHLSAQGIRHAWASYGPAYRLTFESGERIVASQPWNERFLHHPLPYRDDVRFAPRAAWVLTPGIPTDLPAPRALEEMLGAAGGGWRRTALGRAVVYDRFEPPFPPMVEPAPNAGAAGDGDPATAANPDPRAPFVIDLGAPRPLAAVTLLAGPGPSLPRSMDLEISADGATFEAVARRRRREERSDLRWVNGQPQFVIDHDVLSAPLEGRMVRALRITPVASGDVWSLAEVLLHPPDALRAWADWPDAASDWPARRRALEGTPRPDRVDWYTRLRLARARAPR